MIHEFTARITEHSEGSFTARLAPFGSPVAYGTGTVEFAAGSIHVPTTTIPLTVDHSGGALDRIGVLTRSFETAEALFGEFQLADTEAGRDVRELLRMGALADVSVGVELSDDFTGGVMSGTLDHVSVVAHGRFGRTDAPSKVLSVHDDKEAEVPETEEATAPVVAYDDAELKQAVAEMADKIDTFETKVVDEPALFSSVGDFVKTETLAAHDNAEAADKMAKFALSGETTTTAAGVVPDYLASEVLTIIATSRAFLGNIPSDPIGDAGMSVIYPNVTGKGSVAKQATEITEVASSAVTVAAKSADLYTYAGANNVAQQLIMRSSPAFVQILLDELAGQYAQVTNKDSVEVGADAAATFAAFNLASSTIILGVRRPADTVWLAPDRWGQINSLVDADGRPLLVYPANGPTNAQGQSGFDTTVAQYHGWVMRLDVDAPSGTCLIAASQKSVANLESSPTQLSALQVSTLSTEIGIWGLQNIIVKYPEGLYTLTTA